MLVTPRLTVAEVLRADPAMAHVLGVHDGGAPSQAPKIKPLSRAENEFAREQPRPPIDSSPRPQEQIAEERAAAPTERRADPSPSRRAERAESRDLSDADRYRQAQAARAISIYESNQAADRRLPSGAGTIRV